MSRWEVNTVWPYWFIASRGGRWWVCVLSHKGAPTHYVREYGDRLLALRGLAECQREYGEGVGA
jgi:hypothetical protein